MSNIFSDRIADVPRSFIREILKVALDHSYISFAGGLPNRDLFPVAALKEAAAKVFDVFGNDVLQYADSEGYQGLREIIAKRYRDKKGLEIPVEQIMITTGSQQGLDILGKSLLNEGDDLVIEEPGYLGGIQAFSLYKPKFDPVPLTEDGMDVKELKRVMGAVKPKLMYTVPNFQNPSGISYSGSNRRVVAELVDGTSTLIIEDDPYGDLRYEGQDLPSFKLLLPQNTILLGSFSKIIAPGFRLGWIVAPDNIMEKLIIAKQAADLHTSYFVQCLVYQYLQDNDIEKHIGIIREHYGRQLQAMLQSIGTYFPPEVSHTCPQGGMFLWATLPENASTRKLLDIAVKDKVIFVPGDPFYINRRETDTMRLNFSCMDEAMINTGIERLGKAIKTLLGR
ncbi:MAG: PLP-dependent aminotransferase family protein [Dehalococcoidales bacterium]|jgi:2-aminoadipate transaminase